MEVVLAITIGSAAAWLMCHMGAASIEAAVNAMGQLVGGWRGDGWPRGVQEEDRDRPWGRAVLPSPKPRLSLPELKPTLTRVKPIVHQR